MPAFRNPKCQAPDPDDRRTGQCSVEMKAVGERHPSFGPNFKPGGTVFECPRCGAVRFIEDEKAAALTARYR